MDDIPAHRRPFARHLPEDFADAEGEPPDMIVSGEAGFSSASLNGNSAPALVSLLVARDIEEFERTGDPVRALRIWSACMGSGLYPPLSVLKWIDTALQQYADTGGRADIAELLGFRGERGKLPLPARQAQLADAEFRAYWVHLLVEGRQLTIGDAAFMVAAREESRGITISCEWLAENYAKTFRKHMLLTELPDFGADWWTEFLTSFPEYSRPPGLR